MDEKGCKIDKILNKNKNKSNKEIFNLKTNFFRNCEQNLDERSISKIEEVENRSNNQNLLSELSNNKMNELRIPNKKEDNFTIDNLNNHIQNDNSRLYINQILKNKYERKSSIKINQLIEDSENTNIYLIKDKANTDIDVIKNLEFQNLKKKTFSNANKNELSEKDMITNE